MWPQPPQPTCEPSGLTSLQFEPVPEIRTTPPAETSGLTRCTDLIIQPQIKVGTKSPCKALATYHSRWPLPLHRLHRWWLNSFGWELGTVPSSEKSVCHWPPSAPLHSATSPARRHTPKHVQQMLFFGIRMHGFLTDQGAQRSVGVQSCLPLGSLDHVIDNFNTFVHSNQLSIHKHTLLLKETRLPHESHRMMGCIMHLCVLF